MASCSTFRCLQAVLDYSPYDKRCLGEGASSGDLWACHVAAIKTHRPLLQGVYAEQVSRWLRAFGKSQVRSRASTEIEEPDSREWPPHTTLAKWRFYQVRKHILNDDGRIYSPMTRRQEEEFPRACLSLIISRGLMIQGRASVASTFDWLV